MHCSCIGHRSSGSLAFPFEPHGGGPKAKSRFAFVIVRSSFKRRVLSAFLFRDIDPELQRY